MCYHVRERDRIFSHRRSQGTALLVYVPRIVRPACLFLTHNSPDGRPRQVFGKLRGLDREHARQMRLSFGLRTRKPLSGLVGHRRLHTEYDPRQRGGEPQRRRIRPAVSRHLRSRLTYFYLRPDGRWKCNLKDHYRTLGTYLIGLQPGDIEVCRDPHIPPWFQRDPVAFSDAWRSSSLSTPITWRSSSSS